MASKGEDLNITPRADVELANTTKKDVDPLLVAFKESFDAENPRCWSRSRKSTVTDVLSATGFNRIMVSTIMAPALPLIAAELHMSHLEAIMAMSIYILATAFGPMMFGPLSEVYGRAPILHASNIWFLIWNLVCGFANSKGLLFAARLLAGLGASVIYSLAGGVLGDVWSPEQRGRSLGIYLLIPLLGAAVGPIIGVFMAGRTTWRWMFWSTSAFQAVMVLASIPAFHETYAPIILRRRAQKLRKDTGNDGYYTLGERREVGNSTVAILLRSLSRPLRLLLTQSIIQLASVISAFGYGVLYIILSTFSDIWVQQYGQNVETSGLHYIAIALGEIQGAQIGGAIMDRIFKRLKARTQGEWKPEYHLPLMLPSAILSAAGLCLYGWLVQYHVHWAAIDASVVLTLFSMQMQGGPLQAYIIDAYPEHTSSATAAQQLLRSLGAFALPLASPRTYSALGYGWGNTMLAFVTLAFGLSMPLLLWYAGPGLRAKAHSSY